MSYEDDLEFAEIFLENNSPIISFTKSGLLNLTKNMLKIFYFEIL